MIFFHKIEMGKTLCTITYTAHGKIYTEIVSKSEIAEFDGYEFVSILGDYYIADVIDLKRDTITLKEFDNYYQNLYPLNWDGICQKIHAKIHGSGRITGGGLNVHPIFTNLLNSF